ncbi:MAG: hypothetical protein IIB57_01330 [Planctomycetes bacterium]|nr:hypothetical protein [Planctomycetota bacterium]
MRRVPRFFVIGLPSRFPAAWTMAVLAVLGSSAVAHSPTPGDEAAHQWWGDYVTCKTWRDIWLEHFPFLRTEPQADGIPILQPARYLAVRCVAKGGRPGIRKRGLL